MMFYCPRLNFAFTRLFPESDFKSSLNQVHLRIQHALKETSYLTDRLSMTGSGRKATTIGNYVLGENPRFRWVSSQPSVNRAG